MKSSHTTYSLSAGSITNHLPVGHTRFSWEAPVSASCRKKSRAHNMFGSVLQRGGKTRQAAQHYRSALCVNPFSADAHFNLGLLLSSMLSFNDETSYKRHEEAILHYSLAVRLKPTFAEANHNLGCLLMNKKKDYSGALFCFKSALRAKPNYPNAHRNLATLLRRMGQHNDAVSYQLKIVHNECKRAQICGGKLNEKSINSTNKDIVNGKELNNMPYGFYPEIVSVQCLKKKCIQCDLNSSITVVCVKWGTKYSAEYVNKLHRGVKRHLSVPFNFVCFTDIVDDPELDFAGGVRTRPLLNGWSGWWNKATLFAPRALTGLSGRYTVICGPIDCCAKYTGVFATLSTRDFNSEGRNDGYNSSVILWNAGSEQFYDNRNVDKKNDDTFGIEEKGNNGKKTRYSMKGITTPYSSCVGCFSQVHTAIHRFDHWLECLLRGADLLQDLYPKVFIEYSAHCKGRDTIPKGASVINFPLKPKPHECFEPFIKQYWV